MTNVKQLQKLTADYLRDNKMSQTELAERLNTYQTGLSEFLSGKAYRKPLIDKLCEYLPSHGYPLTVDKKEITETVTSIPMEKVSLNTVSDIIDALLNFEIVFIENSNHKIVLEEGFIVRYNHDIPFSINSPLLMDEFYYVMRPKKVKLEEGKLYKTDKGNEVFICKIDDNVAFGIVLGERDAQMISMDGEFNEQRIIDEA